MNAAALLSAFDSLRARLEPARAIVQRWIDRAAHITRNWRAREYALTSLGIQAVVAPLIHIFLFVQWCNKPDNGPINLSMVSELSIVEFQDIQQGPVKGAQDMSEEIIEREKLTEDKPINWSNATDPTLDMDQRYAAKLLVNISPDDYPQRARRANVGEVTVAVTLYIGADGRVRDVKIRQIRSPGNAAQTFEEDFIRSVRTLLLTKTRLASRPYTVKGEARDFQWDTTVTFTLQ